jgi:hypothetical protein
MSSLLMVCTNLSYNHSPLLPILPNAQTNHVDNRQPFPLYRTFRTPLEPLDSILVVFQNYMSYKRNNQQIQWLMRVGAGCALPVNWLRVFRRAKVASLCSGGGPKRETRAVPSEKCVARWGREYDKMRMITTSFARVLARYTGHLYMPFS